MPLILRKGDKVKVVRLEPGDDPPEAMGQVLTVAATDDPDLVQYPAFWSHEVIEGQDYWLVEQVELITG